MGAKRVVVGYRSILVPLAQNAETDKALDVACRLAAEHGATIAAVAVVEVPATLPLDSHMLEEEACARALLTRASAVGDSYGIRVSGSLLRAREAGEAIVEEAGTRSSELVVVGAPRKRRLSTSAPVFGRTTEFVLRKAPCRVMVIAAPAEIAAAVEAVRVSSAA
jgi:APA family basic amino acid/polyamine antiporter